LSKEIYINQKTTHRKRYVRDTMYDCKSQCNNPRSKSKQNQN